AGGAADGLRVHPRLRRAAVGEAGAAPEPAGRAAAQRHLLPAARAGGGAGGERGGGRMGGRSDGRCRAPATAHRPLPVARRYPPLGGADGGEEAVVVERREGVAVGEAAGGDAVELRLHLGGEAEVEQGREVGYEEVADA